MSPASPHFELEQVARGVWAAIARPDRGAVGNAGIVDLGGEALVFDTHLAPGAARDLRAAAEELVGPVTVVVNSHWHGDHVRGNSSMPGEARIVATATTQELVATRGVEALDALKAGTDEQRQRADELRASGDEQGARLLEELLEELPSLEQRLPDETFETELDLGRARLLTFGGGHTDSDSVLLVGDEGVLFTADLVVVETHPWVGHGHVDSWPAILDEIDALGAKVLVPGHGRVAGLEATAFMGEYLASLAEGSDEIPEQFASLAYPVMWERNLTAAREQAAAR